MVKQLNRVIAMLLAMTLIFSMYLALGTSQARYNHSVTWQSVYYPPEPKVTSNRLAEDGQLVLLKDWDLESEANSREYTIKFYSTTDDIYGLFNCSTNLDCVEASLSQPDLKQEQGVQEITLTLHLKDEAYQLKEKFTVSIHISLQTVGSYNKQLWADFLVDLVPKTAQEETTAPTEESQETTAPTEVPEETTAPTEVPEETTAPAEVPEETTAPAEVPEETTAPTEVPEETTAPAEVPEETTAPTEVPEETTAPAETPEETTVPTETSEETSFPVMAVLHLDSTESTEQSVVTTETFVKETTLPSESETTIAPSESETTTASSESETTTAPSESETTTAPAESETTTAPAESEPTTPPSESEPTTPPAEQDPAEPSQPLLQVEGTRFSWGEWVTVNIAMPKGAACVELLYNGASFPAGTMYRWSDGTDVIFGDPMTIQLSAEEAENWAVLLNFKNIDEADKTMQMTVTASASSGAARQIVDSQTVTLDASRIEMENVFYVGSQAVIAGSGETRVSCEWNDEQMDWHIEHLIRDANGELTYVRSDDQFGVTFKLESWTAVLENGESVERKVAVVGNPEGKAAAGSYRLVLSRTTGMETYTAELPFFVHYKVFAPASEQIGGVLQ